MPSKKVSDLSTITPLSTDLVLLDRPTTGPGAPITGNAALSALAAVIGGAISGTFNEPVPAEFVTTASLSLAGGEGFSYAASLAGTDTYFFVSGAIGGKGETTPGVSVFGGDLHVSGNISSDGDATVSELLIIGQDLQVAGILGVTGSAEIQGGITGSITEVSLGVPYIIPGNSNVQITTSSLGQIEISATGGGGAGGQWEDGVDRLATTSSVSIAGTLGVSYYADSIGTDAYFFVSGAIGSKDGSSAGVSVFGGDVHVSGNISAEGNASVTDFISVGQNIQVIGNMGITGSAEIQGGILTTLLSASVGAEISGSVVLSGTLSVLGDAEITENTTISSVHAYAPFYSSSHSSVISSVSTVPFIGSSEFTFMNSSTTSSISNSVACNVAAAKNSLMFNGENSIIVAAYDATAQATMRTVILGGSSNKIFGPIVGGGTVYETAILGGYNNIITSSIAGLANVTIVGGKNWTIENSDTIALGDALGGPTTLLVSASSGIYFGGNLEVTGNISTTGALNVTSLFSVEDDAQISGSTAITGSLEVLTGITGTLYYSASNATNWSGTAPVTVQEALDRIAALIGPIP